MLVKHRIYLSLLLLSLLPLALISLLTDRVAEDALEQLIVRDFQSLAREKADGIGRLFDARINEVRLLARHPSIIAAVQDSNSLYQGRNEKEVMDKIHRLDKAWIASKGNTELAKTIASNELSHLLESIQAQRPNVYGEMFVTDNRGATVAMTKTLSDYYQADEYWWQTGNTYVESGAFLDDRGYDESVGSIVIGVVVPVLYDGEVIGVFKINFRVKTILDIVSGEGLDQGYMLLLARSDGSVISSSDENHPKRLETSELQVMNARRVGIWQSEAHGKKTLAAYYPMKHTFSTRHTKGAIIGVAGETTVVKTWYVIYEVDHELAFASLQKLRETAIIMAIGALALAILMGYLLSRAIFRPLSILKNGTEIIGSGNLAHHITLKGKDEFGALAHSFNGMSKKLQETLASRDELNQEIAERKTAQRHLSRFKNTLDQTLDCVFMFNPQTLKFFYINRGAMQQVGYDYEEFLEMTPLDIKPEFTEESFREKIQVLIDHPEQPLTFETVHRTKQGNLIPVEVFLQYIEPSEEESRFVAIVRDITERKRAEEERIIRFNRIHAYQETIVEITTKPELAMGNMDVIFPFITEAVSKGFGIERVSIWLFEDEPNGLHCIDLYEQPANRHSGDIFLTESDYPRYLRTLHEGIVIDASDAHTDSRTSEFEDIYLKPLNIASMLDVPIRLEGQIVGVVCHESVGERHTWMPDDVAFASEVADQVAQVMSNAKRRQAEEQLDETRSFLQDVIDSMPSMLVAVDPDGTVNEWSQEAGRLTGFNVSDAIGQNLQKVLPLSDELMVRVQAALKESTPQKLIRQESILGGKKRIVDIIIYPLTSKENAGSVLRIDDVTERVRIESMMSQTEKMSSIGGLAAGMSHELNNPLGGILQGLQNIRRRFSPDIPKNIEAAEALGVDLEKIRQYMKERQIEHFMDSIENAGERAAGIIENLVKFIRQPEAGKQAEDIRDLIDRTLDLAALDYDMKKKYGFRELEIVREYDSELMSVPCVASEIQQVLLNGLRNAAQALAMQAGRSEAGQITVRTKKMDNMACIEIEDNGPGMDEQTRKRVFEPFYTTREPGEGTGLGLSVSYYIVHDQHQGHIRMESTPGKGSILIVELPLDV